MLFESNAKPFHRPGECRCGEYHDVSGALNRVGHDLLRDNPRLTREQVGQRLFDEFHEMARRAGVSDETLSQLTTEQAEEIMRHFSRVAKLMPPRQRKCSG